MLFYTNTVPVWQECLLRRWMYISKIMVFLLLESCSVVDRYESFAGMYRFYLSTQTASYHILINAAVSSQDGGSMFLWNIGVCSPDYILLQPGSQLSVTRGRRCIVWSGVWTEYFLSTAQKHNSVNHFNSQAPRNISFLNSYCQLKSQNLSNAGMTDCYNRLWCLWSLTQKMLVVKHRINKNVNLHLSRVTLPALCSVINSGKWRNTHTHMAFHFINLYGPLGFGYETCPQDLTNINRYTQNKDYVHTVKTLKITYYRIHRYIV